MLPKTGDCLVRVGDGSTRNYSTSSTEKSGIALAENDQVIYLQKEIKELKITYENIAEVRNKLEEEELKYVILRYDKGKTHNETQAALQLDGICMSERKYFVFRQKVLYKIARYLGLYFPPR